MSLQYKKKNKDRDIVEDRKEMVTIVKQLRKEIKDVVGHVRHKSRKIPIKEQYLMKRGKYFHTLGT